MDKRLTSLYFLLLILSSHIFPAHASPMYPFKIPASASIILNKAADLARRGNIDQAIELITEFQNRQHQATPEKSIKKGYTHAILDYALGNYEQRQSHTHGAIRHYLASIQKEDQFHLSWLQLAKCYYDSGQMKQAGPAFLKGYEKNKIKEAKYLYYAALCHMMDEDYHPSFLLFKRLMQSHPSDIRIFWYKTWVHILMALEKKTDAIPFMERLANDLPAPEKERWQEMLLYHYLSLNMKKKALDYAQLLTREGVTEKKWWRALAHIHLNEGRVRKGLVALLAFSFLSPLTDEEMTLVGDLHMMLDIPSEATCFYQKLLDRKMKPDLIKKMVQATLRQYDYLTAIEWIDKSIESMPDPELLLLKGKILFETEHFEPAARIFEHLTKKSRDNGDALLMLGFAHWNLNKTDDAILAFQMASKIKKHQKTALQALKNLKHFNKEKKDE